MAFKPFDQSFLNASDFDQVEEALDAVLVVEAALQWHHLPDSKTVPALSIRVLLLDVDELDPSNRCFLGVHLLYLPVARGLDS